MKSSLLTAGNTGSGLSFQDIQTRSQYPFSPAHQFLSVPGDLNVKTDPRIWNQRHPGHYSDHILRVEQGSWPIKASFNGLCKIGKHPHSHRLPSTVPLPQLPRLLVMFSRPACPCRRQSGQMSSQLHYQFIAHYTHCTNCKGKNPLDSLVLYQPVSMS